MTSPIRRKRRKLSNRPGMSKRKRIAIIGHFAEGADFKDGQTVKTRILFEELSATGLFDIRRVDTYLKKRAPLKLLIKSLWALLSVRDIVVLLSSNGMRFYFPLLGFFAKAFGVRIYHDVIGGNLDKYVEESPKFGSYLRSFRVNWVETDLLKSRLEKLGVTNTETVPNFKRLDPVPEERLSVSLRPLKLCTFSRVLPEKGIELAIGAVRALNEEGRGCILDIYGDPDPEYSLRFSEVMRSTGGSIRYCGSVPYDKSVETISGYDALLFPTYWESEGFPGTIVDAFSAGLPVLASDHGSNSEIVKHGDTGLIYPKKDEAALKEAIAYIWEMSADELLQMKKNCVRAALLYRPERYVAAMVNELMNGERQEP